MTSRPPLAFSLLRGFRIGFLAVLCSAAWVASAAAAGDNLLTNGNAGEGLSNWRGFAGVEADPDADGNCFVLAQPGVAISQEFIPVDPAGSYELAGWFRAAGETPVRVYLGFECFDESQQPIQNAEINVIPDTGTELSAPAAAGSSLLKIRDASAWDTDPAWVPSHGVVAFHVKDNYADLPNRDLSPIGITSIHKAGDGWEVVLAKPLERDYPAGTKVRQHRSRDTFCYIQSGTNFAAATEWDDRSDVISGTTPYGSTGLAFWPGTRFVRVVVLNTAPADKTTGSERPRALVRGLSFSAE